LLNLFANPIYAGVYAYGVRAVERCRQHPGRPGTRRRSPRAGEAEVFLHDQLPAVLCRFYGAFGERGSLGTGHERTERPMSQPFDASKSLTVLDQDSTLIVVIEVSQCQEPSWRENSIPGNRRCASGAVEPVAMTLRGRF
jgi:hypothetical protein